MPYNVPPRTPAARVGTLMVGLGAKEIKWKCQRRMCTTLIRRTDIGCPEHERILPDDLLALAKATAEMDPVRTARRRVILAADAVWEVKRRVR
jgi:hypothetical protein